MLTGILKVMVILLGIIALFKFEKAIKFRNTIFICSMLSAVCSLVPLLLFGPAYMTTISYVISAVPLASVCFQAVANRKGSFFVV